MIPLDQDCLRAHPLPDHADDTDKNSRGRVFLVGGARFVPGALRLTGEAALRAGCGKLRMGTIAEAAVPLGVAVPEAAVMALPADSDGEIDAAAIPDLLEVLERVDSFVFGPGMSGEPDRLVAALTRAPREGLTTILDAAAIPAAAGLASQLRGHDGRVILTPHHGEMAGLTGLDAGDIAGDPGRVARQVAERFGAVVALKADKTVIAAPDGTLLRYEGGGVGLATGGSGDVLAGIAGGLASRGADPLTAIGWAVWLHGEAGKRVAEKTGPIGFLARELLPEIPALMASVR